MKKITPFTLIIKIKKSPDISASRKNNGNNKVVKFDMVMVIMVKYFNTKNN